MSVFNKAKDQVPAYQRWEPVVLEPADPIKQALGRSEFQMPTASELEALHQQAHEEGYQAGLKEGAEAARLQRDALLAEEVSQLRELLGPMSAAMRDFDQVMRKEMLALALEISRQMLRQALKVKPELLLPIVQAAMESLPQNSHHLHLHLHAEDAALVRAGMQSEMLLGGWKIIEDQHISRGGCRIETSVSEIDATVENRWQRLAAMLGQDTGWLDE
ncbi:flagellar assembly protein FliH [mine drainage metagenome]|uniref:Flagellar assembly protein FliH n=1 Tax=mine drainage metagenome TaxID=410659 RepID=A0A1J5QDT8_9ZZZZ